MFRFTCGIIASSLVGYIAYRIGSLDKSGVAGLLLSGTALFCFGGWVWFVVLLAFLSSASLLSLYQHDQKRFLSDIVAKTGPRDIEQAMTNVGTACIVAAMFHISGSQILFVAFLGSLAAVNADTWATEVGTLAETSPRLITTWERVSPGTSGGVTVLGTMAGLAGSLFIAIVGVALNALEGPMDGSLWSLRTVEDVLIVTVAGCSGLMLDSFLGATLQARYLCPVCHKVTEKRVRGGEHKTQRVGGVPWFNNDWVNFSASVAGAVTSALLSAVCLWLS